MADKVLAKSSSNKQYDPHPEGQHIAVCVDVIDLGLKVNAFGGRDQHKCALVFQTGQKREDGKPFEISKEFTVSMHEKGNLRPFLESWRGRKYTEAQAEQGTPLDTLQGLGGYLNVIHETSKAGRVYATIAGIFPVPPGMELPSLPPYERAPYWAERKKAYAAERAAHSQDSLNRPTDEDFSDYADVPPGAVGDDGLPF